MNKVIIVSREDKKRRKETFDAITIPHPRMESLYERTLDLIDDTEAVIKRNLARLDAARGRKIKLDELWVLPIYGPSGATKSKSIQRVVDKILSHPNLGENDVPILPVTVRSSTRSGKFLQAQILEAYGSASEENVRRSKDYSEAVVNTEIRNIAKDRRTKIVILDEAHNMLTQSGANAEVMAKAIKSLVNDGIFSVVLVGTDKAKQLAQADEELFNRFKLAEDFGRFDVQSADDREYFFGFAAHLEKKMLDGGVIDGPIGLISDVESRAIAYDMADGVIGRISRILRLSLEYVLNRNKTIIDWDDIELCFRKWNLSLEEPGYDPFADGPRNSSLSAVKRDLPQANG